MAHRRRLLLLATVLVSASACAVAARPQWAPPRADTAYRQGYDRGLRAGADDYRRGDRYEYADEIDYRRADAGYRTAFGDRERYRDEFRRGYQAGYRSGYAATGDFRRSPEGRTGPPSRNEGIGSRDQVAAANGYTDGYRAGLDDAQDRRPFEPISERRYRAADHGYNGRYGSKERYRAVYRDAFRAGYQDGYRDGNRDGRRAW